MRLLVVSTSFPKKPGDSLSPFMWDFCVNLRKRGIDITVLVPHHKGLLTEESIEGIAIRRFRYLPEQYEDLAYSGGLLPGLKSSPLRGLKIPFLIRSMYKRTLEIIKDDNIDIVNFHWLFPACFWLGILRRKANIPMVFTGHGSDIHLAQKKPFRYFANRSLRKSSAVTLNSQYMKKTLEKLNTPDRVEVIPMGVDTEIFSLARRDSIISKKILFVGRLIEQKGVGLLLDAYRRVIEIFPDAVLEIIGDGPEKQRLTARAGSIGSGANVIFSDSIDYGLLPEKYRSATVLALPSLIPEGLGMTAVEAGACGVPTVTFGLGGTSEFAINEKTGLVVKIGVKELAAGLVRLLEDQALFVRLGDSARSLVLEKYSWSVVSEKFARLFESVRKSQ